MRERPILLNSEMVRAVLDGRKTQTRRIMKHQPEVCPRGGHWWPSNVFKTMLHIEEEMQNGNGGWDGLVGDACQFGQSGDRLWVRETFATLGNEDGCVIDWKDNIVKGGGKEAAHIYRASCEQRPGNYGIWSIPDNAFWKPHTDNMQYEGSWVPSIHMPRWASRITLEITGVRVERLASISTKDAAAEGYPAERAADGGNIDPWLWFRDLWDGIYPEQSFKVNPWVWVIEFERVEGE